MSSDKKTIEELILEKPITPEIVNRLFYIYTTEWAQYVEMVSSIINQSILVGVQDIKVLIDSIDTNPSCKLESNIKEKLFSNEKRKIFCMWLFKSHILCLNADERVVGRKIEHDLPVTFKIYFNKTMAKNLNNSTNLEFKIQQATRLQEMIMKQLKPILEEKDFYIKPIGAFTSESSFDSFDVSLGFNTYYSKSEDIYIKTFVKELLLEENKKKVESSSDSSTESSESLEQSEEGFFAIAGLIIAMPWILAITLIIILAISGKLIDIKDKHDLEKFYKKHKKLADEIANILKNKIKITEKMKLLITILKNESKDEFKFDDSNITVDFYDYDNKGLKKMDEELGDEIKRKIINIIKKNNSINKNDLIKIFSDIQVDINFLSLIPIKVNKNTDLENNSDPGEEPCSTYTNEFENKEYSKFEKILNTTITKSKIKEIKHMEIREFNTNPDDWYEEDDRNELAFQPSVKIKFDFSDIIKDINIPE